MAIGRDNPYRQGLVNLIHSIDEEFKLEESNIVLMLHQLDTEEKIMKFNKWVDEHLKGGKLQATETEIVRAAVQASKSIDNNH